MRSKVVLVSVIGVLLGAAAIAAIVRSSAHKEADTSGTAHRRIEATDFTGLSFKGAINVNVTQGETPSVVVTGSEAALERFRSQVRDGVLYLEQQEAKSIEFREKTVVDIVMPTLTGLVVNGAGNVDISDMALDKIVLQINGAGNLEASGTCDQLTVGITGAGNVNARNLKCHTVSAELAGASNLDVFADESLQGRLYGVGNINVYGNPKARAADRFGIGEITYHDTAQ